MALNEIMMKRHASGLERNLTGVQHFVKDKYDEFREMCRVFNPQRGYSSSTVRNIKERYKEINAKFSEARALQQLLRGKYKTYVQLDSHQQRQFEEFYYMYKKDYRYFEQTHSEWELKALNGKDLPKHILSHIEDLYQKKPSLPSLILCFEGDASLLEQIKRRMKMGKEDICEENEGTIWFFLAGIKPVEDPILQRKLLDTLFKGLTGDVKGVVSKISQAASWRQEILSNMCDALPHVKAGEIKVL